MEATPSDARRRRLGKGDSQLLARAAQHAAHQPFLMAHPLAGYRARHHLDEVQLATVLGCSLRALRGLALCRRPSLVGPTAADEVRSLAEYVGCDAAQLMALLKEEATA